jgi:3-oxoacyl-[acyl-carrier protein] reductase
MLLENKIAVVTGAGRGIGKGIALALAREGAMVIVNYNGSKESAETTVSEIEAGGGKAVALQCNVSDFEQAKDFYANIVKEYGKIDILVNNAGITRDNLVMKMSEEEFQDVIQTNLAGTFHGVKFVTRPMMKQRSGRIINIASVSGVIGNMGQANYSASKAGVIGLTKAMAKELASRNITVNAVAPGFIETEMTDKLADAVKEEACKSIPLKEFGKVEDVAEAVVFLASDKARYITGQVLCVDGGIAM